MARAVTTKPEKHAGLRGFARTDGIGNIPARLHGPPYIEAVQPSSAKVVKWSSALWVGALGNHWQLPPLRPAETNVLHVRKTHNEAFVPESGTLVRAGGQMSFRWMAFMTASKRLWVRSFWLMW